jgi:hypothetical protein
VIREVVAPDGSWKIVVEAWSSNFIVYKAVGVTTRVLQRGSPNVWERLFGGATGGWVTTNADEVVAAGAMGSSQLPGVMAPLPGSPDRHRNASSADCRASVWGGALKFDSGSTNPGGVAGGESAAALTFVDQVRGGIGAATRAGVTLSNAQAPASWG